MGMPARRGLRAGSASSASSKTNANADELSPSDRNNDESPASDRTNDESPAPDRTNGDPVPDSTLDNIAMLNEAYIAFVNFGTLPIVRRRTRPAVKAQVGWEVASKLLAVTDKIALSPRDSIDMALIQEDSRAYNDICEQIGTVVSDLKMLGKRLERAYNDDLCMKRSELDERTLRELQVQVWMRMALWEAEHEHGWIFLERVISGVKAETQEKTAAKNRLVLDIILSLELGQKVISELDESKLANWIQETLTVGFRWKIPSGYGHHVLEHFNVSDPFSTAKSDNNPPEPHVGADSPSPKKKSRGNMQDSTGCNDSEGNTASSPLARGPVKQSQDQDSQACSIASSSFGTDGSAHEVDRFSSGNEDVAMKKKEGSRKVFHLSSPVSVPGVNDRSCLRDALGSILEGHIRRKVCAFMTEHMPATGNTPIKVADQALQPRGLYLKRVYADYDKPGGVVYNLLQIRECQMVLALDLTAADGSGVAHHSIGWNGKALLDRPYNNIIEERDRSNSIHARMAFDELYPKETFKDWRIVHAFAIANIRNKKRKRSSRKRKKRKRDREAEHCGGAKTRSIVGQHGDGR